MKTLKLVLALTVMAIISITVSSCDSAVTPGNSNVKSSDFAIPAWDYSESHYFVDTLYKRCFTEVYNDSISSYTQQNTIITSNDYLEVWVQCDVTISNKRFCVGKVMLGERPPQGYDTSIINPGFIYGDKYSGFFRKLYVDEYYINAQAGFIGLKNNLPGNYHVGVVYTNNVNKKYGMGAYESNASDTLILKLVKIDSPNPVTTPLAWQLMMKNVYRIPYTNLSSSSTINVMFNINYNLVNTIPGYSIPLITMLKLDKFTNGTNQPPPDGKFDWLSGKTIFPETGDIIFPILEPFSKGLKDAGVDSAYWVSDIYTMRKEYNYDKNRYTFSGIAVY